MNSAKYRNILEYVKSQKYPAGFSKNEKLVLRKFCKNFEYYLAKKKEKVILSRLSVTPQRVRAFKSVSSALETPESRTFLVL